MSLETESRDQAILETGSRDQVRMIPQSAHTPMMIPQSPHAPGMLPQSPRAPGMIPVTSRTVGLCKQARDLRERRRTPVEDGCEAALEAETRDQVALELARGARRSTSRHFAHGQHRRLCRGRMLRQHRSPSGQALRWVGRAAAEQRVGIVRCVVYTPTSGNQASYSNGSILTSSASLLLSIS